MSLLAITVYTGVAGSIWMLYHRNRAKSAERHRSIQEQSQSQGMTEPASLHPVIDEAQCIGCGACVHACPEGDVLGLIHGKAELVNPTHCIGHGACKAACPMDAITLVFGTEKRGLDIPMVQPNFETNVPGIFIAGELGGMGLIRNAIEQGRQAMESVCRFDGIGTHAELDVVIVGAGPAGFSASLTAMQHKLRFVTLEQDSFGGTVAHFPRGKIVMTAPVTLPLIGSVRMSETSKEKLLEFWQGVVDKTGLKVQFQERVEEITACDGAFAVRTPRKTYHATAVVLCIGRRGTPRTLDVPGEELSKVVYRLIDPEQYRDRHVLVVGGGDSALEAATSIADESGTDVTLSYRGDGFGRAKPKNRERIDNAVDSGRLRLLLNSTVGHITATHVAIVQGDKTHELRNDAVIVCAGGVLPTPFLKKIGIEVETKYGTA